MPGKKSPQTLFPKEEETLLKLVNIFPDLDPIVVVSVMRANFKTEKEPDRAFENCINQLLEASRNLKPAQPNSTVESPKEPPVVVQKAEQIINLDPTPVLQPNPLPEAQLPSAVLTPPPSEDTQNLLKKIEELETAKNRVEEEKKKAMQWCLHQMDQMRKQIHEKDEIIQKFQETIDKPVVPAEKDAPLDETVNELLKKISDLKLRNNFLEAKLKKQEDGIPKPPSFPYQAFQYQPYQLPPQVFQPPSAIYAAPPDSPPITGQYADAYRLFTQAYQQTFKDQEERSQDQFNHAYQQPGPQPLPYPDYRSLHAQK